MKNILIVSLFLVSSLRLYCAPTDLVTNDGKIYHDVTILTEDKTGIKIEYGLGHYTFIPVGLLPPALQQECQKGNDHHSMDSIHGL